MSSSMGNFTFDIRFWALKDFISNNFLDDIHFQSEKIELVILLTGEDLVDKKFLSKPLLVGHIWSLQQISVELTVEN